MHLTNHITNPVQLPEATPDSIFDAREATSTLIQSDDKQKNNYLQIENSSFKKLDKYSLSQITSDLYLTKTQAVQQTPETLVRACLQRMIANLKDETDIYFRCHRFTSLREKHKYNTSIKRSEIRLENLQKLPELSKGILCELSKRLYAAMKNTTDNCTPSIFWSVHDLNKRALIRDNEFIDNLIISLINQHLIDLSNPNENQATNLSENNLTDFFLTEDQVYYASGEYKSDKSIDITNIRITKLKNKRGGNCKLNIKFYFDIEKAEDSEGIKNINLIKKQIFLETVYKEQVSIWMDFSISKIQKYLELNLLTQDKSTCNDTTLTQVQENKFKLQKLKELSAASKDKLCEFIACLYESLISLKKAKDVSSKNIEYASTVWDFKEPINSKLIDDLIISTIDYYVNLLLEPQVDENQMLHTTKARKEERAHVCELSVIRTDKNKLEITNADLVYPGGKTKFLYATFHIKDTE